MFSNDNWIDQCVAKEAVSLAKEEVQEQAERVGRMISSTQLAQLELATSLFE